MKRQTILWILVGLGSALGMLVGCHANPDDPAGQAEELADPVRRENAVANLTRLYGDALAAARRAAGDNPETDPRQATEVPTDDGRTRPGPKAIVDASIEALVRTYRDHPEDTQNGGRILELLRDMHDLRALPAYVKALDWRAEVSEEHAITAARAIEDLTVPDGQKAEVVTALSTALDRVQGSRGVDNRMRIYFIRALGSLHDRAATPELTKIATRLTEDQNFLINRMAAEEVGDLGDPAAVPAMIKALFLFNPQAPVQRMNDVGGQALVQIGQPALNPLLALLRGTNEDANRVAQNYIRAVTQRDADAGAKMDPRSLVIEEACFALGQLGPRQAMDPMMEHVTPLTQMSVEDASSGAEANRQVYSRALTCTTSLIQINRQASDTPRLRQTLIDVYHRIPEEWPPEAPGAMRSQLLAASMHTYDAGLLDFLHGVASDREGLPDFRVVAARSYAFLAAKADVPRLRAVIDAEPEGGQIRHMFEEMDAALDTADQCDDDVQCYVGKLGDSNPMVVRKAAYMIARYGRGNAPALTALIEQIDHRDVSARGDVLYAIDWVATHGSPQAVAEIDRIREAEEGRSSWTQIQSVAMAVRARLKSRSGS
jgi:HEAT repeat protein